MRVLVDIVHPAHVHFYRHLVAELEAQGHQVRIVARKKDVTTDLLDRFGLEYESVGEASNLSRIAQGRELVARVRRLRRAIREFDADVVLTRNPAGVQAARIARTYGIFDTDDGRAAGVHFRAAAPFAHLITTPDSLGEDHGDRHVTYPSYKVLAYLHPDRFAPDESVLDDLGVAADEPYAIVRFVTMTAAHDHQESGLPPQAKREAVDRLRRRFRVFVTTEGSLPAEFADLGLPVASHRLHDALAFASVLVGDSQTMAAEAAVLGVPNVRCSSFAGRLGYLEELEHRYQLTAGFRPDEVRAFMDAVESTVDEGAVEAWAQRRAEMLGDKCDLTSWYRTLLDERGFG